VGYEKMWSFAFQWHVSNSSHIALSQHVAEALDSCSTETRSHSEMVGNMSCVTLNFDLWKIPFVHF